jgi:hypothetical protein
MSQDDDDDGGDDAKLRSLRAVWLAMPDEDPPERGLDALMAAARTKASEMAQGSTELPAQKQVPAPSWWEKLLAGFRRPTVLAFASVVVLVAGAAVISSRGGRGIDAGAPHNSTTPSSEEVPLERRDHESLKDNAPPPAAPEVMAPGGGEKGAAGNSTGAPRPHFGAAQHEGPREGVVKETAKGEDALASDRWEAVPMDPTPEEVAKKKLLDEAKTAAVRGDCNSARTVARQLEKQDLGYYRSRVVPDQDISGCLQQQGRTTGAAVDSATATKPAE